MKTPYAGLDSAVRLNEKYPGTFDGLTPTAFDVLEKLTSEGLMVQIGSFGLGPQRRWSCETMWRGQSANGKVFYSNWNTNLAEALVEVFESYMDHMKALEQETGE
jgi:hypothetical protein